MSRPVRSVKMDARLVEVQAALSEDISCVAVVDDAGRLVGVASRTDLIHVGRQHAGRRPASAVLALPDIAVSGVMSGNVAALAPDDSVRAAAQLMLTRHVHRVFVVDSDRRPVGVLSTKDVMAVVSDQKVRTPIEAFMTTPVFSIRAEEPLALGVERLERAHVSGLVVVEDDWPVGLFTQRESIASGDMPRSTPIEEAMCPALLCLDAATPLHHAAAQAVATRARRVIATGKPGMRGILTGLDFTRAAST